MIFDRGGDNLKKIILTGATSMLGVATIQECLYHDIEVVAVAHRNSKNLNRLPKSENLTLIERNLDEFVDYTPEINDAEVFYHFGWAATSHEGRTNVDIQESNIRYTLDAVRLANKFGCKKFIFAGSQAEYGLSNKPLNRNTAIQPFTAYGVSKFAAGKLSEMLCNSLGITFVWSRILSVYGINDGANTLISYIIDCYRKNIQPVLTPCEQIYDLMQPNVPLTFGGKNYSENQVMYLQADISDLERDTGFKVEIPFEKGIYNIISSKC